MYTIARCLDIINLLSVNIPQLQKATNQVYRVCVQLKLKLRFETFCARKLLPDESRNYFCPFNSLQFEFCIIFIKICSVCKGLNAMYKVYYYLDSHSPFFQKARKYELPKEL